MQTRREILQACMVVPSLTGVQPTVVMPVGPWHLIYNRRDGATQEYMDFVSLHRALVDDDNAWGYFAYSRQHREGDWYPESFHIVSENGIVVFESSGKRYVDGVAAWVQLKQQFPDLQ